MASAPGDLDQLFAALQRSNFRQRFRLGAREQDYLQSRGLPTVLSHAADFIAQRLAPAEPRNDGKQTPMRGHPVFIAQHATATCCRGCLAKWHGIPAGRAMSPREQGQAVAAIERWLRQQARPPLPADQPIAYMERTREWYLALGYGNPYQYAHHEDVPFQPLKKPLAECVVALLTTAAPYRPDKGPQGPGAPYNAAAKFFTPYTGDTAQDHDLRIAHVAIDRVHTSMEDSNSWFPLPLMRQLSQQGRFRLASRFHGVPTNRSQRHTIEVDIPLVVQRCREDGVDAAVLVPNCPVCHQTLSLAARALEAAGISTVVMGCARDIVEHAGVPRFVFSDFPLGNAAGKPHDAASQEATLGLSLEVLQTAIGPRTTVQSAQRWSESSAWKLDYCNVQRAAPEQLARLRAEMDAAKETAKGVRQGG